MLEKFISKLDFGVEDICINDRCWDWKGTVASHGYGVFYDKQKRRRAHRVAWEIFNNKLVPSDLVVCHKCDNRKCCNPYHLFLGSQDDNIKDCMKKKRHVGYLTWKIVEEIRECYKNGYYQKDLAKKFNTSQANIHKIVNNKTWVKENKPYELFRKETIPEIELDTTICEAVSGLTKNDIYNHIMYDYSMLPDVNDIDCERLSRQMSKYEREKLDGPR